MAIEITMEEDLWRKLPRDILFRVLQWLPTRIQVKIWKDEFSSRALQKTIPNIPLVSIPAFFFHINWKNGGSATRESSWVIEETGDIYEVPMQQDSCFEAACSILYSCSKVHRQGSGFSDFTLYICNPGTRTSTALSCRKLDWRFNAMHVDTSSRSYTFLLGRRKNATIGIDIYYSESNTWAQMVMPVPFYIHPYGNGVYSKGRFYWLSVYSDGKSVIVEFSPLDRSWTKIPLPDPDITHYTRNWEQYGTWELTGSDDIIVLVNRKVGCLWRLSEDEKWYQLHMSLPKGITKVAVNKNGSLLLVVCGDINRIFIYDREGIKELFSIELSQLDSTLKGVFLIDRILVSGFESNNLWWP